MVEKIIEWRKTSGIPTPDTQGFKLPQEDRLKLAISLVDEEFREFLLCISKVKYEEEEVKQTIDALGDLLWVVISLGMEFNLDMEEVINRIHKSNMSKFDFTEEDAKKTAAKYEEQGIDVVVNKDILNKTSPYVTVRKSDNKILKSHNFIEPDFSGLYNYDEVFNNLNNQTDEEPNKERGARKTGQLEEEHNS